MPQFSSETEFDKKLKEINDAYESVKDAMNFYGIEDRAPFEALRTLRDYAATGVKSQHQIQQQ